MDKYYNINSIPTSEIMVKPLSLLDKEILNAMRNGYHLFERVSGIPSPAPQSNAGRAIKRAMRKGYTDIICVVGGRIGNGNQLAIMVREVNKEQ